MLDEELSATSHEEATKVFEFWQTEDDEEDEDDMSTLMEVDQQIGSDLLDDAIFYPDISCLSPVGPIEELALFGSCDHEIESIFIPGDESSVDNPTSWQFDEQYKSTLRKLSESMKRSQETRMSLTMKTLKTEKYARSTSVSGVISSIEKSSEQLKAYLVNGMHV